MNRLVVMLFAVVALYWVWALFSETEHRANPAEPIVVASSSPTPVPAPSASRQTAPVQELGIDPAILKVAYDLAAAEGRCTRGIRTACVKLETNDRAGLRQLTSMRENLGKKCKARVAAACFARGEIEFHATRRKNAEKFYGQAQVLLKRVANRCKTGQERDPGKCTEAGKTLAAMESRKI